VRANSRPTRWAAQGDPDVKTVFGSLRVMRDWLVEAEMRIAAMESASTY
jgi:hypothetical protein